MNYQAADHDFSLARAGPWCCALFALLVALAGLLAPWVITEMQRQAAIAETARFGAIYFDSRPPHRLGYLSSLLPKRYQKINQISLQLRENATTQQAGEQYDLTGYDFRLLGNFPELKELTIDGATTEAQLLALPPLDKLEKLVLISDQAGDVALCHVTSVCPAVTRLKLSSSFASGLTILGICQLEGLKELYLRLVEVDAHALRPLSDLKHLEKVQLDRDMHLVSRTDVRDLSLLLPIPPRNFPSDSTIGNGSDEDNRHTPLGRAAKRRP